MDTAAESGKVARLIGRRRASMSEPFALPPAMERGFVKILMGDRPVGCGAREAAGQAGVSTSAMIAGSLSMSSGTNVVAVSKTTRSFTPK